MIERETDSNLGTIYKRFFDNGSPDPAGSLLNAGIGLPARRIDWWDVQPLWSHPYYALVMMLGEGSGFYRNEDDFQCELSSETFLLTFPGHKQRYGPAKGQKWGELYVGFEGDIFQIARKRKVLNPEQPVWKLENSATWIERLQKLLQTPDPPPQKQFRRAVHFFDFLLEMLDAAEPVNSNTATGDWFALACQMITTDLHHKIDWEKLATSLGMSYHTFRLYFRRRAGMAPLQYREQHRFQNACNLLTDIHYSCKDIAFVLGFANPDHFSEQFKKRFGMSPLEYRKRHLKK
jgi:AraC-like DNA-binding protein